MTQKRGGLRSGARGPLLFLVLQQVGRPVARHPSPVHHLQGGVATGVVHAAQGRVSAEGGHIIFRLKVSGYHVVVVHIWLAPHEGKEMGKMHSYPLS